MITLAPIKREDAPLLKEVRLRALQDTPHAFGSTYAREAAFTDAEWIERASKWGSGTSMAFFAMDDGKVCGIAAGFLHPDDHSVANLVSMWVAPTHRRAGVGRMLVEAIFEWTRSSRALGLHLMVTSRNQSAERFYEQLGFTRTGKTEPYPNDPTMIEYEMARLIADT